MVVMRNQCGIQQLSKGKEKRFPCGVLLDFKEWFLSFKGL
jgi:hypothetical protein